MPLLFQCTYSNAQSNPTCKLKQAFVQMQPERERNLHGDRPQYGHRLYTSVTRACCWIEWWGIPFKINKITLNTDKRHPDVTSIHNSQAGKMRIQHPSFFVKHTRICISSAILGYELNRTIYLMRLI